MKSTTGFTLATAAVLLLGVLVWSLQGSDAAPPGSVAANGEASSAAAIATTADVDKPDTPDRVVVRDTSPDDSALDHPFAYDLDVRVVDRLGLPVAGAKVLLAPFGCRLGEVPERTDDAGRVHIAWRGRLASMPMVLAIGQDETRDAMRQLVVQSGSATRVVLGGRRERGTTFRLLRDYEAKGGAVRGLAFALDSTSTGKEDLTLAITGLVVQQGSFADNPAMRTGLHPFASFADVQLRTVQEPSGDRGVRLLGEIAFDSNSFTFVASTPVPTPAVAEQKPLPARIAGVVYGEDGKTAAKCPVSWGTEVDRPQQRMETNEQGAFVFDDVPEGKLELRAGGNLAGLQHMTVSTMRGQTTKVDVNLRREVTVRGKALASDGKPLAGHRVEWVGTRTLWFDAAAVGKDGTFVLPNLPGGEGRLLLWRGEDSARLPVAWADVLPDNGEVVLRLDPATTNGQLVLEPLLPEGIDQAAVEVRIFQEDTGRGTTMSKVEHGNQFAMKGLALGWYRLELGGPGLGWVDGGRHYVDGKGTVDVGRVAMASTGTVRLQFPAAALATSGDGKLGPIVEIYRHRTDADVRIEELSTAARNEALQLAPGDYFVMWQLVSGDRGFVPFTVQAGRELTVPCAQTAQPDTASTVPDRR